MVCCFCCFCRSNTPSSRSNQTGGNHDSPFVVVSFSNDIHELRFSHNHRLARVATAEKLLVVFAPDDDDTPDSLEDCASSLSSRLLWTRAILADFASSQRLERGKENSLVACCEKKELAAKPKNNKNFPPPLQKSSSSSPPPRQQKRIQRRRRIPQRRNLCQSSLPERIRRHFFVEKGRKVPQEKRIKKNGVSSHSCVERTRFGVCE